MKLITRFCIGSILAGVTGVLAAQTSRPAPSPAPAQSAGPAPAADITGPIEIPSGVEVLHDVPYCMGGTHQLLLDMYLPKERAKKPVPAVLWIHGGGWRIGNKNGAELAVALAARGFVTASINYRLVSEGKFPAAIEDAKCAVRFLRANAARYGIDPNRIGAAGSSAGAHLAMLVGTAPLSAGLEGTGGWEGVSSKVSAVVSWFGPTDFSVGAPAFERGKGPSIIGFLNGTLEEQPDNYRRASPISWVAAGDPPLLMFHGLDDTTVPEDQSVRMEAAYRKAGLDVELVPVQHSGHGFKPSGTESISPAYAEILKRSVEFFETKLAPVPPHP